MTTAKNHPVIVTLLLIGFVGGHAAVSAFLWSDIPSVDALLGSQAEAWGLYAAAAGASAIIGGFSGVLVVFAMSSNKVFAKMRLKGGASLEANWLSTVASSLGATLLSVVAAGIALGEHGSIGAWIFEAALLIGAHASFRMIWLLSALVTAVRRQDEQDVSDQNALTFDQIVGTTLKN